MTRRIFNEGVEWLWKEYLKDAGKGAVLVDLLKACAKQKNLCKGSEVHAHILSRGLFKDSVHIGNNLIHMYAKCGALAKAKEVFTKLSYRDIVSWNALITGCARHGNAEEVLSWFEGLRCDGLSPDAVTFVGVLKACGCLKTAKKGKEIHEEIIRQGLLEKNIVLGNALMDMYVKCGMLASAEEVFCELPVRDIVSWNVLIMGYAQDGYNERLIKCLEEIECEHLSPDAVTFSCILKACGTIGALMEGQKIHAQVTEERLLVKNIVLGTALVDMYARCNSLLKAQELFDELPYRDVISWTGLIAGYAQHGYEEAALDCLEQMQIEGFSPNATTYVCSLKACVSMGAFEKGKELHAKVVKEGMLGKNVVLDTALMDMFTSFGAPKLVQQVFDSLQTRDSLAFACILKTCGHVGALKKGIGIHTLIVKEGLMNDVMLGTAIVDMYTRCGVLAKAQEVFDALPFQDIVSWTTLIAGYAQLGRYGAVFESFDKMIGAGIKPDPVTFTIMLSACSFLGLVDEGQMFFESMITTHSILPSFEHLSCLVDLFCRAGYFDKAITLIKKLPSLHHPPLWLSLLSASHKWGSADLGRWGFEHAVLRDKNAAI